MFSAGSRPWDKGGGAVIQTLRQGGRGGGGLQKFFRPFQPQFGLKIRGRAPRALPMDPLLMLVNVVIECSGGYLGGYFLTQFRLKTDSNWVYSTPTRFFSHFSLGNNHFSSVTVPRDQGMSRLPPGFYHVCLYFL